MCPEKNANTKGRAPQQSIKVGSPMQLVAVDILGPLPESQDGNSYVLVVANYFTRWAEAFPIPNQETSTVAQVLTNKFFFRFSPPERLHSNQGKQFESELVAEVCKTLGITKSRTTPYHPQCDGVVKCFNRTLLDMLATAATQYPFEWQNHLRPLCMAYNSSIHSTTGYSPFSLMFGRQAKMPVEIAYGQPQPSESQTPATYASKLQS